MMSAYDPYVNMLRTTVAAFAAGVGGAEAVTVLPFDEPLGLPEAFSRRIARNISSLLISESHVATVADPAGGAHAVEKLTDDLARAAWELFGELDAAAGSSTRCRRQPRERIAAAVEARGRDIATRTRPLTGAQRVPQPARGAPRAPPVRSRARRAPLRRGVRGSARRPRRDAGVPRDDGHARRSTPPGPRSRPTCSPPAASTPSSAGATEGVDDVLKAYHEAGEPPVVCLAGPDAAYEEWGADLVAALREAGARHVIVAGKADLGADDDRGRRARCARLPPPHEGGAGA